MAGKPRSNPKRKAVAPLVPWSPSSSAAAFSPTLTAALEDLRSVYFSLAWDPPNNTAIHLYILRVNGRACIPDGGVGDKDSPLGPIFLGQFPVGSAVTIEWKLVAYNNLNGIAGFAGPNSQGKWEELDRKVPFGFQETWASTKPYKVT